MLRDRPVLLGVLVALGVLAFLVGVEQLPFMRPRGVLGGVVEVVVSGVGVGLGLLVARHTRGAERTAWLVLAGALSCWAVGGVAWGLQQQAGASFAEAGVVVHGLHGAGGALVLLGLRSIPKREWCAGERVRARLDAAALFACLLVVLHLVLLRDVLAPTSSRAGVSVAVGYAVLDLVLVVAAVGTLRRCRPRHRPQVLLVVLAAGVITLGDAGLLLDLSEDSDPVRGYADALFAAGATLLAAAALAALRPGPRQAWSAPGLALSPERLLRLASLGPDAFILVVSWVVLVVGPRGATGWTLTAVAAGLAAARQIWQALDARRAREELERTVAERTEELQEVSAGHGRILDAVGDGIVGIDENGLVTFLNAGALKMLGWSREQVLGRDACEVLCVGRHEFCVISTVLASGVRLDSVEATCRRSDGSLLPVELNAAPKFESPLAGYRGVVVAFRDVTAKRVVEQHKQQFVSSVSHELRTPLTSIRGVLEMLVDGDAGRISAEARRLVSTAERGVGRLGRLVDDIIDIEKLATGSFSVVPESLDLQQVLNEAVASLLPLGAQVGVSVFLEPIEGGAVWCDRDRVEQALVNLIGNAVKFSSPGGVVEVGAIRRAGEAEVWVRDEGRGIPAEEVPHVFERFRQVSVVDAKEKGGAGLGLTITRSIIEQHGGRIWVESTEGLGSVFRFTLPTVPSDVRDEVVRTSAMA